MNSASERTIAALAWRTCASGSVRWSKAWSRCTLQITKPAARNCFWARDALSPRSPSTLPFQTAQCAIFAESIVVINTGTRATIEDIPGLTDAAPLTHVEALELDRIPEHVIVIGGGYVGLEFSQAMRRFGSRVTILERNPSLLHREDEDVSHALHELFQNEGIEVLTDSVVTQVQGKSGTWVKLRARRASSEITLEGTDLLVATGRTPNTQGIGLDLAGVELTERGYIKVNERLQTTASGVWAAGDCAGSPHFTHISFDDYRVVRDNILGRDRVTTGRQVPFCMFTDPELA